MNTKARKLSPALTWALVALVSLFCITAIAAIMNRTPDDPKPQARESIAAQTAPAKSVAKDACQFCGVIESTREITVKGDADGLGAVGGAVVGGVLGHQVGGGSGKDIATVVGAVGGAYAGHEIEKNVKSGKRYETTVRFDEGGRRVFTTAQPSQWRQGDRVKVTNNTIVAG